MHVDAEQRWESMDALLERLEHVLNPPRSRWRAWNQHTDHVTNVCEDGTTPQFEVPSWQELDTFRTNAKIEGGRVCRPEPKVPERCGTSLRTPAFHAATAIGHGHGFVGLKTPSNRSAVSLKACIPRRATYWCAVASEPARFH